MTTLGSFTVVNGFENGKTVWLYQKPFKKERIYPLTIINKC